MKLFTIDSEEMDSKLFPEGAVIVDRVNSLCLKVVGVNNTLDVSTGLRPICSVLRMIALDSSSVRQARFLRIGVTVTSRSRRN